MRQILENITNDKGMVIICATILGLVAMTVLTDPVTVVSNIVTGLFGVAVGQSLPK